MAKKNHEFSGAAKEEERRSQINPERAGFPIGLINHNDTLFATDNVLSVGGRLTLFVLA